MSPWVRTRRNHAIEHATVAGLVQQQGRRFPVFGISDPAGFVLIGTFDPGSAAAAADEALVRLQAGQHSLAVTDDCGTSLLANGILTAAAVVALTRQRPIANLPMAIAATIAIGRFAPRLGRWLQRTLTLDTGLTASTIARTHIIRLPFGYTIARISTRH